MTAAAGVVAHDHAKQISAGGFVKDWRTRRSTSRKSR